MLDRCYNPDCTEYPYYGLKGIKVCNRWHNFAEFLKDCRSLPNWSSKRDDPKGYALDKDYFGASVYSPTTCVWLNHTDNRLYAWQQPITITFPDGRTETVPYAKRAARLTGVRHSRVLWCAETGNTWQGFAFQRAEKNLRYPLPNDQIKWVLRKLKDRPMSRDLVVSAWQPHIAQNPPDPKAYLAPCHCMFILNVQNVQNEARPSSMAEEVDREILGPDWGPTKQRLCLHLTQRSADCLIGVPFNIASYALLLSLMARFSDIEPGIFGHTLVDAHVYTAKPDGSMAEYDHVPGAKEQLSREPRPLPRLIISDDIRSLEDVERLLHPSVTTDEIMNKFILEGYDPHLPLRFRVAV